MSLPTRSKSHVGPGKKVVSFYADAKLHQQIKTRAKSLGLSASKYVEMLALKDIKAGGDFNISANT